MLSGWVPSSRARTSSDQTPVALTMMEAATSMVRPSASTVAPGDRALGVLGDAPQGGPVDDRGAVVQRGRAGHGEHEAGVVGLGVVVEVAPGQPVTAQRRHVRHGLVGRESLVQLPDPQAAGEVVHPHGRAHRSGQAPADEAVLGEDGDEEGQHVDQVGRRAAEDLALAQGLVDEADLPLLQVAQPPVDQLGRLARGARGEVVALDQGGAQAPRGGVEGHPHPGDAAADDQDVEGAVGQPIQARGAVEVSGSGHGPLSLGVAGTGDPTTCRQRLSTTRMGWIGCPT